MKKVPNRAVRCVEWEWHFSCCVYKAAVFDIAGDALSAQKPERVSAVLRHAFDYGKPFEVDSDLLVGTFNRRDLEPTHTFVLSRYLCHAPQDAVKWLDSKPSPASGGSAKNFQRMGGV